MSKLKEQMDTKGDLKDKIWQRLSVNVFKKCLQNATNEFVNRMVTIKTREEMEKLEFPVGNIDDYSDVLGSNGELTDEEKKLFDAMRSISEKIEKIQKQAADKFKEQQ